VGTQSLGEITQLFHEAAPIDRAQSEHLVVLLRDELHTVAASMMRSQPAGHTLQTTALVNEMYLRLMSSKGLLELGFDVTPDGQRLLLIRSRASDASALTVLENAIPERP